MIFVKNHQLKIIQDYTYDTDNRKDNDPFVYLNHKVYIVIWAKKKKLKR